MNSDPHCGDELPVGATGRDEIIGRTLCHDEAVVTAGTRPLREKLFVETVDAPGTFGGLVQSRLDTMHQLRRRGGMRKHTYEWRITL